MKNFTEKQKDIINAAVELIAEKGIQQLTIKNLAQKLDRTEGAVYRHFESKTDIVLGILQLFKKYKMLTQKRIQDRNITALLQLKTIFTQHCEQFAGNPALAAVIFSEEIFQNEKQLAEAVFSIMQNTLHTVTAIITKGQKNSQLRSDIPSDQLTLLVIGAFRLLVTRWRLSGYAFDLQTEGEKLWESIDQILRS